MSAPAPDALKDAVCQLTDEARSQLGSTAAQDAYARWQVLAPAGAEPDAPEVFASEAAFAAAARLAILDRLGATHGVLAHQVCPQVFASPLLGWYEPSPQARSAAESALREAHDQGSELLGWLYQFTISEAIRKRFGQFYTSRAIVDAMLDEADFTAAATLGQRVLDPACGAGAFLLAVGQRVRDSAQQRGDGPEAVYQAVQQAVHGLDLDVLGVLLCATGLVLDLADVLRAIEPSQPLAPLQVHVADSLTSERREGESEQAQQMKTRAGEFAAGFDLIVANPPYAKVPSASLTAQQRQRFGATTYGHPNLYGLFMQLAVELLADEGQLVFINPTSFSSGLYFKRLRAYLREHTDIVSFTGFESRTELFAGVLQEVVITHARKGAQRPQIALRSYERMPVGTPAREISAPSASVLLDERMASAFFIDADEEAHELLAAMLARGRPLSELGYKAITGQIVWNRLKGHLIDDEEPQPDTLISAPLIWSNGVRAYQFVGVGNRQGRARRLRIDAKTQPLLASGEAVLVKRLTAKEEPRRIVACRLSDELAQGSGYFVENHVNVLVPNGEPQLSADALVGLLNSSLLDRVFRALNGNTQVSATELNVLPLAVSDELEQIAVLSAQQRREGYQSERQVQLDELVRRLYGVG